MTYDDDNNRYHLRAPRGSEVQEADTYTAFTITSAHPNPLTAARVRWARDRVNVEETAQISIGDVRLDVERHLVHKRGKAIHFTPKEFRLLHLLMANAGTVVPHVKLLRTVLGPEYRDELHYIRLYVRQMRLKIEDDPANPTYLLTEPHYGYRFCEGLESL